MGQLSSAARTTPCRSRYTARSRVPRRKARGWRTTSSECAVGHQPSATPRSGSRRRPPGAACARAIGTSSSRTELFGGVTRRASRPQRRSRCRGCRRVEAAFTGGSLSHQAIAGQTRASDPKAHDRRFDADRGNHLEYQAFGGTLWVSGPLCQKAHRANVQWSAGSQRVRSRFDPQALQPAVERTGPALRYAEASAEIDVADMLRRRNLAIVRDSGKRREQIPLEVRGELGRNITYASKLALQATNRLVDGTDSSAPYNKNLLHRQAADVRAGSLQFVLHWEERRSSICGCTGASSRTRF